MFEVVKFERKHAEYLLSLSMNEVYRSYYNEEQFNVICENPGVTIMKDGVPLASGGMLRQWKGHAFVWTLFNEQSKYSFVVVFRHIKGLLKTSMIEFNRLSVAIPKSFPQGVRRAEMLGFEIECKCAKKYFPTGEDAVLMAYFGGQ